jgi:hypothetical protein
MEVKDSNYPVDAQLINNVTYVVNNHISAYTNNFAMNGGLYRESINSERPSPNSHPAGWIIYIVDQDAPYSLTQGINQNQGDIYYGIMAFQPRPQGPPHGTSIDTAQTLGIGQQQNSGQILIGNDPCPLVRDFISRIIYNRAPHHTMMGGVDTEAG